MSPDIFYDAVVFRAGKQVLLFSTFDHDGLRFPADWHRNFGEFFLSVELLPHREVPFILDSRKLESRLGVAKDKSWARIIPYSGFCTFHSFYEFAGAQDDHVFYRGKHGKEIRGVEVIVRGGSRSKCRDRMETILSQIGAEEFVGVAYSGVGTEATNLVKVGGFGIQGRGVFSKKGISPKEEIGVVTRPLVQRSQIPEEGQDGYGHNIQVERGWWIPMNHTPFYYVNHSCEPNSMVKIEGVSVSIESLKKIGQGSEITIDYSPIVYHEDQYSFECKCGTTECRGLIKGIRQ